MKPRRAISMLELLAATVVVAALAAAVAQLVVLSARQQAEMEHRLVAVCEAQHIVERVRAMQFDEIDEESLQALQLSANAAKVLRDGQIATSVVDEPGPPAGKRVVVEVTWQSPSGAPPRPVRLTTWRFAAGGES